MFARALASSARVSLIDDPDAWGDSAQVDSLSPGREERARGRCYPMTPPEIEELKNCHRAYVFHEGRCVWGWGDRMSERRGNHAQNIIAASLSGEARRHG